MIGLNVLSFHLFARTEEFAPRRRISMRPKCSECCLRLHIHIKAQKSKITNPLALQTHSHRNSRRLFHRPCTILRKPSNICFPHSCESESIILLRTVRYKLRIHRYRLSWHANLCIGWNHKTIRQCVVFCRHPLKCDYRTLVSM